MKTEWDIREGIENDEFVFFYQPKVSLITGKATGAEALIRWIKPDGTIISPNEFIPIAEQSTLIKEITCHMLPKLVKDVLVLTDVNENLVTSFNTSAKDFEDDSFTQLLLHTLKTSALPANKLQIELTETATFQAGSVIKENIMILRNAGLGLAMDDFGTGYSSIDTLSKLPFTSIKLDQGIIGRMLTSDKNSTIVSTSIRLAHELGLSIVAEGVEREEEYHHLLNTGCTEVQGFWISKAVPMSQFISFISADFSWSTGVPVGLIHMAIVDHIQWRKILVSELIKIASLPVTNINRKLPKTPPLSCRECRLGRWYYGVGQMFSARTVFQELEQPHEELHRIGQLLVKLVSDGANMEVLTPHLQKLSASSMEVLSKLQNLEDEGLTDLHMISG
jgi:EAL domain-containing protein (putative c-di-GMP-specific phosphodiesterase class I)